VNTYLKSLEFKLKSVEYHKEKCQEALDKPVLFNTDESRLVAISSEFTAMMLVFQSCVDIVGQYINDRRGLGMSHYSLYFSTIMQSNTFSTSPRLEGIRAAMIDLHNESRYIFDYCNTIKHRNLIYLSDEWFFISPYMPVQYFYVDSFKRYPKRELKDLLASTFIGMTSKINRLISQV
jgi:hypothetical protein